MEIRAYYRVGGCEDGSKRDRSNEIKGIMNGAILSFIFIFYVVTTFYPIRITHFFIVLGTVVLIQGIYGLIKGNSTKSFIPHVEKIAIYEKEKMGNEWWKQRFGGGIVFALLMIVIIFSYVFSQI